MKKFSIAGICIIAALAIVALAPDARAYVFYSDATNDVGQCGACHTGFRDNNNYSSAKEGVDWGTSLHNAHLNGTNIASTSCDTCHGGIGAPGRTVRLSSSAVAADGVNAVACIGCHGRLQDANAVNQNGPGWGAGLRQQHNAAGVSECLTCHADSDPAAYTPVGEEIPPPWYASVTHDATGLTMDPCNTLLTEVLAGVDVGLDNDGDGASDGDDTDCGGVVPTPGESSGDTLQPLLVTAYDGSTISLTYEAGCSSSDHNMEWGPLAQVGAGYSSQTGDECGIGNTGSYVWSFPATPEDIFFLIVGNDGAAEGSLGLATAGERPENSGGICDIPQSLSDRCD